MILGQKGHSARFGNFARWCSSTPERRVLAKRVMRSLAENQDVAALHKMPTGVEGFDAITGGGLPRNRTSLILGGPGRGKTVFALQTVVNGARQFGEPGIFVAFEENSRTF